MKLKGKMATPCVRSIHDSTGMSAISSARLAATSAPKVKRKPKLSTSTPSGMGTMVARAAKPAMTP